MMDRESDRPPRPEARAEGRRARALAGCGEGGGGTGTRALGIAFWAALGIGAMEVAGGLVAHSLALFSDAGHMLTDMLALALAWYTSRLARQPATPQRTYGFYRAGILAALVNAALLVAVAVGIAVEAALRLWHPSPVRPAVMGGVALVALLSNLWLSGVLGRAPGHDHGTHGHGDLNLRGAWLHVMGDAGASAGVLLAGLLVALTHWVWWDALVSVLIAALIARGAWRLVGRAVDILMEGTPPGIDPAEVAAAMAADDAVLSVHHLHVWSLDGTRTALSGHVVVRDLPLAATGEVIDRLGRLLRRRFGIAHTTLQLESASGRPCPHDDCGEPRHGSQGQPAGFPSRTPAHHQR